MLRRIAILAALLLAFAARLAWALECDQFTVPDRPLADLGQSLDAKVIKELRGVVAEANRQRASYLRQADQATSANRRKAYEARADEVVSQPALAQALFDAVAGGAVPKCRAERWLEDRDAIRSAFMQPMPIRQSIYSGSPFQIFLVTLSPTLRLHDQYVGVDKVGHFFQQGHEYYVRYYDARLNGQDEAQATQTAVRHGVRQENGFYGEAIIGVYSNADLAANYAGLLFYRNLLEPIELGEQTLSPMVVWQGDQLVLSDRCRPGELLLPWVTEHWNESMNPSQYTGIWRSRVREHIEERAERWLAFYGSTVDQEIARLARVRTFHGVSYGHSGWAQVATIANTAAKVQTVQATISE